MSRARLPYPIGLLLAARRADMDAPRTPYAAARERAQYGIALATHRGRQHIVRTVRGEGLAILANQRSW